MNLGTCLFKKFFSFSKTRLVSQASVPTTNVSIYIGKDLLEAIKRLSQETILTVKQLKSKLFFLSNKFFQSFLQLI